MNTRKTRKTVLGILGFVCAFAMTLSLTTGFFKSAKAAESTSDTDIFTTDVTEGEYETVLSRNFNNDSLEISGSDAMWRANGFAGVSGGQLTIKENGFKGDGDRCISAMFAYNDGGWPVDKLYINCGETTEGSVYKLDMLVKPTDTIDMFYVLVCSTSPSEVYDNVLFRNRTANAEPAGSGSKLINAVVNSCEDGVYDISIYLYGNGGNSVIFFQPHCTDYASANTNFDSGLLVDDFALSVKKEIKPDVTDGEYKTVLSRNFNNDSLEISGSDAMWRANGFAGVSGGKLTIKENGFKGDGDRCLSAMFAYNDGGWQIEPLYINCGETTDGSVYKFDMLVKTTGTVDMFYVRICSTNPGEVYDNVLFQNGTFNAEPAGSGSKFIKCVLNSYNDGIYDISIYAYGNGGNSLIFFQPHCTDYASANTDFDSGLLIDDFAVSIKKVPDPAGFNVTERFYNAYGGSDLKINSTFADVAEITVDGETLASESYTFEDGLFTFKAAYLAGLSHETHAIVAKNAAGEESTLSLAVDNAPTANIQTEDFSKMPDLNGGQDAKDNFFRNSWFDPASYDIYTEGTDESRVIKFVPASISDGELGLFQTNPNEGRMHYLTKDKIHTLGVDFKPLGAKVITLKGFAHGSADTSLFTLEIDLSDGRKLSGTQNLNLGYDVTEKEDGWYRLSISFKFTEDEEKNSYAFVQFFAPAASLEAAWYMDNFTVDSEVFAELGATEPRYDRASSTRPYAIIDLKDFEIASVKEGETVLVKDTDYTLTETPTGSIRLDLTEAFCAKYDLGAEKTITVETTKNTLTFSFAVVDTEPVMDSAATFDVAYGKDLGMTSDFKGYEIERVEADEEELGGSEYMLNSDGNFVLKFNYLKGLTMGDHTFVIFSKSGAKKTLTLTIKDSTPVFDGGAVYDKTTNADYTVSVNLFEKELTEVKFDGTVLTNEEYSYENGTLTIKASVLQAKNAGKYILTVTTVAERTLEVEIKDVAPVISGDYTIAKGNALNLTVDLGGKEILSVKAGELELTDADYSYENGVLTINAEVLSELAEGEQTITLTTTGGSVTKTVTLTATGTASSEDGCASSLGGGSLILFGLSALVTALLKRKHSAV